MPKYDKGFYLNDDGAWIEISFQELKDENRRALLRGFEIRERPDGAIKLGIRQHKTTPHFFRRRAVRSNIEQGVVESKEHNRCIDKLFRWLTKNPDEHIFGYYEKFSGDDKGFDEIARTPLYKWDKEVRCEHIYSQYCIFDLMGRSDEFIGFLDSSPHVAIEVVDTHFHSLKAFKALLDLTKNLPVVVFYYYLAEGGRFNGLLNPNRIRVHHYIAEGSFWQRDTRIEDDENVEIMPSQRAAYYNLIKSRLVDKGLIRSA